MRHHAKAVSAGSTKGTGNSRGRFRRAFATRGVSNDVEGSGVLSYRRAKGLFAVLALAIAALALTAAPALAAPPSTTTPVISDVSYASAHVNGKVTTDGSVFNTTAWAFQYSTDGTSWSTGLASDFTTNVKGAGTKEVEGTISVPKGGTKYFVRLVAENGFFISDPAAPQAVSPGPNPSFTTLVADPPVVEATDNATEVEYTTASVSGKVNRPTKSNDLTCNFEYITDAAYQANPVGDRFSGASPLACEPNPVEAEGSSTVKASITGLANATTYHLRLAISGAGGADAKESASTFTTQAVTPPTVVSVDNATNVFSRSADAAGMIKRSATEDPAFDIVACRFEFVTAAQFGANGFADAGSAPCVEPIDNTPDAETSVTANLTGLDAETTYHLRLAVENAAATPGTKEAPATFTTTAIVAKPTVISVQNATDVDQDTAKVSGEVEGPAGADPALDVSCRFEYVTEAGFQGNEEQALTVVANAGSYAVGFKGSSTSSLAFDAPAAAVEAALESLPGIGTGNVSVRGGVGSTFGVAPYLIVFDGALAGKDVEELTTDRGTLSTPVASGASATVLTTAEGGHAPGFVDPGRTDCDPLAPGAPQEVKVSISGLLAGTTYHLRLTAENGGGSDSKDAASTFTTAQNLPASALLGPITEITGWGATLSGEADADNFRFSTGSGFEVSTDGVNWTNLTVAGGVNGAKLEPVGPVVITGLKGGTKYFARLRLIDCQSGICLGDRPNIAVSKPPYPSFTTLPVDPATVLSANDATDVTVETAKVSGEIERSTNPDHAFDANCHFDYVTEAQFQANGYQKALQVPCGIDPLSTPGEKKAVEAELTDLKSGTKYHVRLTATNAGPDASLEAANTFTTVAVPTTVTPLAGASDGEGGYFLAGLVNPRNSTISDCKFVYGPNSGGSPSDYAFTVPCSPTPDSVSKPVTVEGHVTGLTPDATYHFRLVVTNVFGTVVTADQIFVPTLAAKNSCPNEQLRTENSSLALPECRAYEMVTPPGKEGFGAVFGMGTNSGTYDGDGDRFGYFSGATNIAKSGQGSNRNAYVAGRTAAGWETIPNLNGSSGSFRDAPSYVDSNLSKTDLLAYSPDLRSSAWMLHRQGDPDGVPSYLRGPDGALALIGKIETQNPNLMGATELSDDLSHLVTWAAGNYGSVWGPGVYEFLGTGMDQPRRVDLDNSGSPVSSCLAPMGPPLGYPQIVTNVGLSVSSDGGTILFKAQGALDAAGSCEAGDPPADEIWARINGTTAVDVSASRCDRVAPAPACNAPANAAFLAATPDASRVFFATTQQLVNADTDETNDIYACDIPTGNPAPTADKANHCTALVQVSGAQTGAKVEFVEDAFGRRSVSGATSSEDGSTVSFVAQGILADNKDALGGKAVADDHNLYVWRADTSHPDGQTTFVGRLDSNDVGSAQITPDGRYAVFTTTTQLVDTDTDSARDVYRYDADSGTLTRVSTNVFGVAGNAEGFDARIGDALEHNPSTAISDDGTKIVFTTTEPLNLAVDGNEEPDIYLWTPSRVSLISTGAVGAGGNGAFITASGRDIYFQTSGALTPADGDDAGDIYDARIGGGFSFAQAAPCSGAGGTCQSHAPATATVPTPATAQPPADPGNVKPKTCPKGKVLNKKGKCVKKKPKKHSGKKHHGKKAGHKQRGGK